jgi:hypothetical protein
VSLLKVPATNPIRLRSNLGTTACHRRQGRPRRLLPKRAETEGWTPCSSVGGHQFIPSTAAAEQKGRGRRPGSDHHHVRRRANPSR